MDCESLRDVVSWQIAELVDLGVTFGAGGWPNYTCLFRHNLVFPNPRLSQGIP